MSRPGSTELGEGVVSGGGKTEIYQNGMKHFIPDSEDPYWDFSVWDFPDNDPNFKSFYKDPESNVYGWITRNGDEYLKINDGHLAGTYERDGSGYKKLSTDPDPPRYVDIEGKEYVEVEGKKYVDIEGKEYVEVEGEKYVKVEGEKCVDIEGEKYVEVKGKKYVDIEGEKIPVKKVNELPEMPELDNKGHPCPSLSERNVSPENLDVNTVPSDELSEKGNANQANKVDDAISNGEDASRSLGNTNRNSDPSAVAKQPSTPERPGSSSPIDDVADDSQWVPAGNSRPSSNQDVNTNQQSVDPTQQLNKNKERISETKQESAALPPGVLLGAVLHLFFVFDLMNGVEMFGVPIVDGSSLDSSQAIFINAIHSLEDAAPDALFWSGSAADAYQSQLRVIRDQVEKVQEFDANFSKHITEHADKIIYFHFFMAALGGLVAAFLAVVMAIWRGNKANETIAKLCENTFFIIVIWFYLGAQIALIALSCSQKDNAQNVKSEYHLAGRRAEFTNSGSVNTRINHDQSPGGRVGDFSREIMDLNDKIKPQLDEAMRRISGSAAAPVVPLGKAQEATSSASAAPTPPESSAVAAPAAPAMFQRMANFVQATSSGRNAANIPAASPANKHHPEHFTPRVTPPSPTLAPSAAAAGTRPGQQVPASLTTENDQHIDTPIER